MTDTLSEVLAVTRLKGTLTIPQVAERVGHVSELAFSKAFRRLISMPPGAYARRHTKGSGGDSPQQPDGRRR